jgi:8-oxo-dGTP diphosphatase
MTDEKCRRFSYDYPRPALTVDLVVMTREDRPRVLLIRRLNDPFAGTWALPGGFVEENERHRGCRSPRAARRNGNNGGRA